MQKHGAKFNAHEGLCCKDKTGEVKKSLFSQQIFFQKVTTSADSIVKALCGSTLNSKKIKTIF